MPKFSSKGQHPSLLKKLQLAAVDSRLLNTLQCAMGFSSLPHQANPELCSIWTICHYKPTGSLPPSAMHCRM